MSIPEDVVTHTRARCDDWYAVVWRDGGLVALGPGDDGSHIEYLPTNAVGPIDIINTRRVPLRTCDALGREGVDLW